VLQISQVPYGMLYTLICEEGDATG
jgi:hypothetical protein